MISWSNFSLGHHAEVATLIVASLFTTAILRGGSPPAGDVLLESARQGEKLAADEVRSREAGLLTTPDDAGMRASLLGFYQLRQVDLKEPRFKQIQWVTSNRPADNISGSIYTAIDPETDPEGYARIRALWLRKQHDSPTNLAILRNAANFLRAGDDPIAERFLLQGKTAEPTSADWPLRLAQLYSRRFAVAGADPGDRRRAASAAYAARELAGSLTEELQERFIIEAELPRDAYRAGDTIGATRLAAKSLALAKYYQQEPASGFAHHIAEIVLGQIAFRNGDFDHATDHLLAAARVTASPQLTEQGPDLALAKQLLIQGRRDAVHDFLIDCLKIWPRGATRLKGWANAITAGKNPDFGNLAAN